MIGRFSLNRYIVTRRDVVKSALTGYRIPLTRAAQKLVTISLTTSNLRKCCRAKVNKLHLKWLYKHERSNGPMSDSSKTYVGQRKTHKEQGCRKSKRLSVSACPSVLHTSYCQRHPHTTSVCVCVCVKGDALQAHTHPTTCLHNSSDGEENSSWSLFLNATDVQVVVEDLRCSHMKYH